LVWVGVRLGLYQRSASVDQLGNESEADQLDYCTCGQATGPPVSIH
jgi:hypothetical protein